jgi:hypothetical protein
MAKPSNERRAGSQSNLPTLAVDVLAKVLCRARKRGDDVADVDLLARAGLSGDRLQRAFEPSRITISNIACRTRSG